MSDESHSAVPREGDVHHDGPGAPSLSQPGRDEGRRQGMLSRRPSNTVEGFAQQFSAVQQQTEAIQHTCPGVMYHPPLPPGPGLSLPVAVGALLRPPKLLRSRPARRASRSRAAPPAGNPEMLEFAQETARGTSTA